MTDYYYDESASGGSNNGLASVEGGGNGPWETYAAFVAGLASLVGGDTVTIRTADAGGNLGHTLTANTTWAHLGTFGSKVEIILDDGTVWATGGGGVFQLTMGTTSVDYNFALDDGSYLHSADGTKRIKFIYLENIGNFMQTFWVCGGGCRAEDYIINIAGNSQPYGGSLCSTVDAQSFHRNVEIIWDAVPTQVYLALFGVGQNSYASIDGLTLTNNAGASSTLTKLAGVGAYGSRLELKNVTMDGMFEGFRLVDATSSGIAGGVITIENVKGINANSGRVFDYTEMSTASTMRVSTVKVLGGDNRYDLHILDNYCYCQFIDNGSFPGLAASLPDGDKWSVRMYPHRGGQDRIMRAPPIRKQFQGTSEAKLVELELLINTNITDYTKANIWIEVSFENASTGAREVVSSQNLAGGALAIGEQNGNTWTSKSVTPETYGAYALSVSTVNAVANNSYVMVQLCTDVDRTDNDNNALFYCPDPVIKATI